MDLGQLEAFVQVANQRSFSRAAEALFLTQPSVTARIQALERDLGERLFERSGRGVRLTEVGACFLPHAERVLQALHAGRDAIDSLRNLQSGSLILASATTVSTYILPGVLKTFRSRFPRVEVSVRTGRSEQVLQMLLQDEAQVGLVRAVYHQDIETKGLIEDELVLVANANHELVSSGFVTVEQLGDHPFIFFDRNSSYYSLAQGLFRQHGVVPRTQMELDSMEATKKMVEEGLGIALLPRIALERELETGILREIDIEGKQNMSRQIALISRRSRPLGPVAQAFVEIVQEIFVATSRPGSSPVAAGVAG
ncbi:MAG TPA: LysR family transcriptional regulator [Dehalococcoidia bacterium]|nr:LysR family transcriptional regulator [Dehalococcoidia bacterium]